RLPENARDDGDHPPPGPSAGRPTSATRRAVASYRKRPGPGGRAPHDTPRRLSAPGHDSLVSLLPSGDRGSAQLAGQSGLLPTSTPQDRPARPNPVRPPPSSPPTRPPYLARCAPAARTIRTHPHAFGVDDIAVEGSPSPHAFGVDDAPTPVSVPNPVPKAGHLNRAPLGKFSRAPKASARLTRNRLIQRLIKMDATEWTAGLRPALIRLSIPRM